MKIKRIVCMLLAVIMAAMLLAGCAGQQKPAEQKTTEQKNGKISISLYAYDRSMFKELTPWLEAKFPEIEFTFVQSYNTMEYYKDLLARGEEIPDIITCRRFSLNDAAPLADHLMDLSTSEVAGTFYASYLDVNRETSGAIRWLPMCAEVDSIVANKDLFDQYNTPCLPIIPSSWQPSTPSRSMAFRASRPTGIMTTAVWKPCRAVPSRS